MRKSLVTLLTAGLILCGPSLANLPKHSRISLGRLEDQINPSLKLGYALDDNGNEDLDQGEERGFTYEKDFGKDAFVIVFLKTSKYGGKTVEGRLANLETPMTLDVTPREMESSSEPYIPYFYFKAVRADANRGKIRYVFLVREPGKGVADGVSFTLDYERNQDELEKEKP